MPGSFPYYDPSQDPNANPNNYQSNSAGGQPNPYPLLAQAQNNWGNGSQASASMSVGALDTNPNDTVAGQYAAATQAGSQQAQQQAYNQTSQLAQGQGPSLATQLLNQNEQQAMGNANALASSAGGSQSALARRQAMMQGGQMAQSVGGQAATARAQEQLGALQLQGQQAGQIRSQDQNLAAQGLQSTYNQAGLNLGQYGVNKGVQVANTQMAIQGGQDTAMALGSLAMMSNPQSKTDVQSADMHLSEPGGGAHWIIREEPNFLLAANARTGEFRKILTAPLSPEEHSQAMKKHGAGPVGSPNPGNKYYGDLDMSNPQAGQMTPPMAQPQPAPVAQPVQQPAPMQQPAPSQDVAGQMANQAQTYNQGPPFPTNTSTSPGSPAANSAADAADRRQKASEFLKAMGHNTGPQVSGLPKFDAPTPQTFQFSNGQDNKAADADLGGQSGDDYSKQFQSAAPGFVKQPEQASTLSSPPAAKTDIQPAEAPIRHGSDQVLAWMDQKNKSSYGLQDNGPDIYNDPKAAQALLENNRRRELDTSAAALRLRDKDVELQKGLGDAIVKPPSVYRDMAERPEAYPAGMTVDRGQADKESVRVPTDKQSDMKIYDRGSQLGDPNFVVPEQHMNEEEVTPEKETPVAKPSKYSGAIAADVHLGGLKTPKVRTPGVGAPKVRTPEVGAPKVESALRKLSPYTYRYKNPANQPAPARSAMSKYFGVMTTDVKKDPVAKNMVFGRGAKEKIAVPAATSFNLAAGAHLQKAHDGLAKRVSKLEQMFSSRRA